MEPCFRREDEKKAGSEKDPVTAAVKICAELVAVYSPGYCL